MAHDGGMRTLRPLCIPAVLRPLGLAALLASLPAAAQTWDLRAEFGGPRGQSLPPTLLQDTNRNVSGTLDAGQAVILSLSHRLVRLNPVMKLEAGLELARWGADGSYLEGDRRTGSRLTQQGLGAGLNLQFWIPFSGVAAEAGLLQRVQDYRFRAGGQAAEHRISRTWLRIGVRWRLPYVGVHPYLCASYQEPLARDRPAQASTAPDLAACLAAQGTGQEFSRMWTIGLGAMF